MARPVNPDATLARRLRDARDRLGLSQRELGLLMGLPLNVAAPRINQYERGSAAPSVEDLSALAGALGLPAAVLVTEDDALVRLLYAWSDAPNKARSAAVRTLEAEARSAGRPGRQAALARVDTARAKWAAAQAKKAAAKRATAAKKTAKKVVKKTAQSGVKKIAQKVVKNAAAKQTRKPSKRR